MPRVNWYWHRLRAMKPHEMLLHARKKLRQFVDAKRERDWSERKLEPSPDFPALPNSAKATEELRAAVRHAADEVLAGRWRVFGGLDLKVDDPPQWHRDYLAGVDLSTARNAFKLDHRALPQGADIKLIWELSRWQALVRLAQAAWLFGDEKAGEKCLLWLEDWVKKNPPYCGWNWTSALEAGMRLVQFTWIDALLGNRAKQWGIEAELDTLRYEILPPHAWFCWRHRSFGSSANNHLLGELAGLAVATARWPALAQWSTAPTTVKQQWEREVLSQFAEDGGNREQALNYHLFSLELCLLAGAAFNAAGLPLGPAVRARLSRAWDFFVALQVPGDAWDYGDSDNALVSPVFRSEPDAVKEWREWLADPATSSTIQFWLRPWQISCGSAKNPVIAKWERFPESGLAAWRDHQWMVRWDLSPLGYLSTAAHGHLDALHLSLWHRGAAVVVDPGTGCYYQDLKLRTWLASREAHNAPCPTGLNFPERKGPFLWSAHHGRPEVMTVSDHELRAALNLPAARLDRRIYRTEHQDGWVIEDACASATGSPQVFAVRWQFGPGSSIHVMDQRVFLLRRGKASVTILIGEDWAEVLLVDRPQGLPQDHPLAGTVSPAFRQTVFAPYLLLVAPGAVRPEKPCVFRTTFLASAA